MRLRRVLCGLAGLLATGCLTVPAAQAHLALVGSQPADATSLTSVPRQVTLRFDETVSPRFRKVELIDARGRRVGGTSVTAAPGGRELTLHLPAGLRRGPYEVTWEALSKNDGHVTGGALVLGLGAAAGPVVRPAPASGASTADSVLRWIWLACLLAVIGVAGFALVVRSLRVPPAVERPRIQALSRVALVVAPAAGIACVIGVAVLLREAASVPGDGSLAANAATLLGERWGLLWLAAEVLFAALILLGLRVRRVPTAGGAWALVAGAALALSAVHVAAGHAANLERPAAHVAAGAVHLVAAGLWLGGVAAFAVALWPRAGMERTDAARLARAVRGPFGALAGCALLIAVITGLVAVGAQVASVDALLTTNYGEGLLAKSALMAAAGIVGLVNMVFLLRGGDRVARGGVARLMAIEVALGLGALLAVAEMTASAPPRGAEFAAPRPVRPPVVADQVGDLLVAATARPNRAGTNVITVSTTTTRRFNGAPVTGVSIVLRPQAGGAARAVALTATAPGRWTAGAQLPSAGRWTMAVRVRRRAGTVTAPLAWRVEPADLVLPVRYSARRLAPLTERLALVLAAGALAGGLVLLTARRRSGRAGLLLSAVPKDLA